MTQLEKIQKQIDRCNNKNGCRNKCTAEQQKDCYLLHKHTDRRDFCREHGIEMRFW